MEITEIKSKIKEIKGNIKEFTWYLDKTSPTDDEVEFHNKMISDLEDELYMLNFELMRLDNRILQKEIDKIEKLYNATNNENLKYYLHELYNLKSNRICSLDGCNNIIIDKQSSAKFCCENHRKYNHKNQKNIEKTLKVDDVL